MPRMCGIFGSKRDAANGRRPLVSIEQRAAGAIRLSLGRWTTDEDVGAAAALLAGAAAELDQLREAGAA